MVDRNDKLMPPLNRGEQWLAAQAGLMDCPKPDNRGEQWQKAIIDHLKNDKADLVDGKVPVDELPPMDYIPLEDMGQPNGVATLDDNGIIPSSQLPSYVDDVIEGYLYEGHFYEDAEHTQEIEGEKGIIYIDNPTGFTYRWSGDQFIQIGGTEYTEGNGIDIADGTISVDTSVIQEKMSAGQNIRIEGSTISAEQMIFITDNAQALKDFLDDNHNIGKYVQWTGLAGTISGVGPVEPYVLYAVEADA